MTQHGASEQRRRSSEKTAALSLPRRVLKLFHAEAIPWPGTVIYNALSGTSIFQRNYELVARDILEHCAEGKILDVGTGPGWLLIKLRELSPRVRPYGLDASPSMIAAAQTNVANAGLAKAIRLTEGNADHLPFADDFFDAVVSTGSIHHWKDPTAGLNEVHRVLKPGGYALMYDVVSDMPAPVLEEAAHEFGRLRIMLFWLHGFEEPFYSRRNFQLLARRCAFRAACSRFVGVLCCLTMQKR